MFIKIAHNRLISSEATAWLKKMDSQNTIVNYYYHIAEAGFMPASAA